MLVKRPKGQPVQLFSGTDSSGILIEYIKSRKVLRISGWYDHICGMESEEISLAEFLSIIGEAQDERL